MFVIILRKQNAIVHHELVDTVVLLSKVSLLVRTGIPVRRHVVIRIGLYTRSAFAETESFIFFEVVVRRGGYARPNVKYTVRRGYIVQILRFHLGRNSFDQE